MTIETSWAVRVMFGEPDSDGSARFIDAFWKAVGADARVSGLRLGEEEAGLRGEFRLATGSRDAALTLTYEIRDAALSAASRGAGGPQGWTMTIDVSLV